MNPRSVVATLVGALLPGLAVAHPYLPLRTGDVAVLDYRFHVETSRKEFQAPATRGTMTITTEGTEEKHGKTYVRFRVSYEGIAFMTEDVVTWRREENGIVYAGSERGKRWVETVELPKDVSVGQEWDYDDGEPSRRKVTAKLDLELGGTTMKDCIEVTRVPRKAARANVTNEGYYCPDVGEVKFHLKATSPVGDYVTETSLRKHTPAK